MRRPKEINLIIFLTILICGLCMAATPIFVDPGPGGNDGNGGVTPGSPKKTILSAIGVVDDPGTIKLMPGTYNDASQGAGWKISMLGTDITFEPHTTTVSLTFDTATDCIRVGGERSGNTWTFNNITFNAASSRYVIYSSQDNGGSLVFNDVIFNGDLNLLTSPQTSVNLRELTLTGCTLSSSVAIGFQAIDFDLLKIDDCDITNTYNADNGRFFDPRADFGRFIMTNSRYTTSTHAFYFDDDAVLDRIKSIDITGNDIIQTNVAAITFGLYIDNEDGTMDIYDGITVRDNDWSFTTADTTDFRPIYLKMTEASVVTPIITGNVFSTAATDYGDCITLIDGISAAIVENNYASGFLNGVLARSKGSSFTGNTFDCVNGFKLEGVTGSVFNDNTVIAHTSAVSSDTGRCLVFGRRVIADEVAAAAANTFTATTFISNAAWVLSSVVADRTMIAIAYDGDTGLSSPSADFFGIINTVNDGTDTITVDEWIKVSDYSIETPVDTTENVTVVLFSEYNRCYNNLFDGSDAVNTITYDFSPRASGNLVDFNTYIAGSGAIANINAVNQTTLAALQSKWAAWPTTGELTNNNDQNSRVITTSPFVNKTGNDFRLNIAQANFNTGEQIKNVNNESIGQSTVGSWKPLVIKGLPLRGRLSSGTIYD